MAAGRLSKQVLNTSGLEVRWYRPPNPDMQAPHDRDEVYVVVTGHGEFVRVGTRIHFSPGDLLFAAKGEEHRSLGDIWARGVGDWSNSQRWVQRL